MDDNKKKMKKLFKILIWLIVLLVLVLIYRRYSPDFNIFRDADKMKNFILEFKHYGIIVFIALQVIQVVIFFIPGEVVQMAGGYIFGPFIGSIVSIIGILIGSMLTFYLAKAIGEKKVNEWIKEKKLNRLKRILQAGRNNLVIFAVYFIPGVPKDLLGYVSGISGVEFRDFILYSMLGRAPWIIVSAMFGHGIDSGNYTALIIIAVVSVSLFFIGIFRGSRIIEYIHKRKEDKRRNGLK